MKFTPTPLEGAYLVDIEPFADERGFFARVWCEEEFAAHGLESTVAQCNISFNPHQGTLRGMHFQREPFGESKLVRCTSGAIYDVIVDLRPDSPTYARNFGAELTAENRRALAVPQGFAHGFVTLVDDTEVIYQMSRPFEASAANGVRWNDPTFGIVWPQEARVISERDRAWPDFVP